MLIGRRIPALYLANVISIELWWFFTISNSFALWTLNIYVELQIPFSNSNYELVPISKNTKENQISPKYNIFHHTFHGHWNVTLVFSWDTVSVTYSVNTGRRPGGSRGNPPKCPCHRFPIWSSTLLLISRYFFVLTVTYFSFSYGHLL